MTISYLLGAILLGIGSGGIYFFALWRATKTITREGSVGVGYLLSRMLSLMLVLGVLAAVLSIGAHPFYIIVAMMGFFLARIAATRWAQSSLQKIREIG